MPNFFSENADLQFQFQHLNLQEVVEIIEHDFQEHRQYNYAPRDYSDALVNYR
jgi:hypothetical protein